MLGYKSFIINLFRLAKYNMRIIFGGKFGYFILAALIFFLLFGTIMAFEDSEMDLGDIYGILLFPAILLVFYPTAFGIQNDADQRTLEIIFGIPDYRYKVWLLRFFMVLVLVFILLIPFASIAYYALMSFPLFRMVFQLMVLVLFTSSLGFMISTLVKSGNAAAVIMVVIGLAFLILGEPLEGSKWNIFLNPFNIPRDVNDLVWQETIRQNRLFMGLTSVGFILSGLLNLQKRERFL
ncbi:MAG: hypothetical protein P1P82_14020 [Bacteroidales bacterium]|nr:hypothetical protein [Bacteroidales bacterium]MDT8432782.1 hypothetical protein [Bacteroidales bacterium]